MELKGKLYSYSNVNCDGQVSEINGKSDPVSHPVNTVPDLKDEGKYVIIRM